MIARWKTTTDMKKVDLFRDNLIEAMRFYGNNLRIVITKEALGPLIKDATTSSEAFGYSHIAWYDERGKLYLEMTFHSELRLVERFSYKDRITKKLRTVKIRANPEHLLFLHGNHWRMPKGEE